MRAPALLELFTIIVIPVLNPDGYAHSHSSPAARLWRKNRAPNAGAPEACKGTDIGAGFVRAGSKVQRFSLANSCTSRRTLCRRRIHAQMHMRAASLSRRRRRGRWPSCWTIRHRTSWASSSESAAQTLYVSLIAHAPAAQPAFVWCADATLTASASRADCPASCRAANDLPVRVLL